MILPTPQDAIHKAWLYRLLTAIADNTFLTAELRFKGGTCAAMQNIIDRFSVDLDFDLLESKNIPKVRKELEQIFKGLDLQIKDQSKLVPQYFLKYPNQTDGIRFDRNTIRIDITCPPPKSNEYEAVRFIEIDRILYCETVPTMFANKLVALKERFEKFRSIAGRDLFDIHTFFLKGHRYKTEIIEERTGKKVHTFLLELQDFIEKKVTQMVIDQDLNVLIPPEKFRKIRTLLKSEVLMFLRDELVRNKLI